MENAASVDSATEDVAAADATAGLRNELSESNDQIANLKTQLEEAMRERTAGQEALEKLKASFEQLQNDVGQHKHDLDEAKKESATLSEELEKEKANHEQYLKFKASSESDQKEQTKKLTDEIEKLSQDNKSLREEANQAKIELDIAAKAGSELAAKVKSLEEAISKGGAKDSAPGDADVVDPPADEPPIEVVAYGKKSDGVPEVVTAANTEPEIPKVVVAAESSSAGGGASSDNAGEKMSAMKAKLLAKKAALEEKKAKLAAEKKRKAEAEASASEGDAGATEEGGDDEENKMKARLLAKKAKKGA